MLKRAVSFFEKHNKISWIITLLIAVIVFYISSLTFEGVSTGSSINTYIYHFIIFFILAFFLLISLIKGEQSISYKIFILGIFIAIIYAISDELHQFFVPGRSCCISDILMDSAGILIAGIFYKIRLKSL